MALSLEVTLVFGADASSSCDKPHDDLDELYYLNMVYQQVDADLNTAFGRLRGNLDLAHGILLCDGQSVWLRARDRRCSRHGSDSFFVNLSWATSMTISRT